jgi:hypothetical protein
MPMEKWRLGWTSIQAAPTFGTGAPRAGRRLACRRVDLVSGSWRSCGSNRLITERATLPALACAPHARLSLRSTRGRCSVLIGHCARSSAQMRWHRALLAIIWRRAGGRVVAASRLDSGLLQIFRKRALQAGGHRFDPGWFHHLDEGRTGPVPQGAGPSASSDRQDRVHRLIEALLAL